MNPIDPDSGAEIVRFPAAPKLPETRRSRAAAGREAGRPRQQDPGYWREKALAFRHEALTARSTDAAAIMIRRAEEFEQMALAMEADWQPAAAVIPETPLRAVVDLVRDHAERLRDTIADLPLSPLPGGVAFAGLPTQSRPEVTRPIARRAQRLVVPPPPPPPPRPPAGPIARRAQRLARG
jgi:hypothetical protein